MWMTRPNGGGQRRAARWGALAAALGMASLAATLAGLWQIVVELRRVVERGRYAYLVAEEGSLFRVERATGKLWRLVGTRAEAGLIFYEWQPMPLDGQ